MIQELGFCLGYIITFLLAEFASSGKIEFRPYTSKLNLQNFSRTDTRLDTKKYTCKVRILEVIGIDSAMHIVL